MYKYFQEHLRLLLLIKSNFVWTCELFWKFMLTRQIFITTNMCKTKIHKTYVTPNASQTTVMNYIMVSKIFVNKYRQFRRTQNCKSKQCNTTLYHAVISKYKSIYFVILMFTYFHLMKSHVAFSRPKKMVRILSISCCLFRKI